MNIDKAKAALADVKSAEGHLADRIAQCPPWRHAAFGVVLAILIGSISISTDAQIVGSVIALALVALLVRHDLKRYGVFVNGYRKGATLPIAILYVGVLIVLVSGAMYLRVNHLSITSKLGFAAIAFALATAVSVKWNNVYRKELGGGTQ